MLQRKLCSVPSDEMMTCQYFRLFDICLERTFEPGSGADWFSY
jgi:hypothetical protein